MSVFRSVRCVVLDLDDTLYLERDYVRSGFHAVGSWMSSAFGISTFGDLCWRAFLDGVRHKIFDHALREAGMVPSEDLIRSLVDVYRSHVPRIGLLPDALACLRQLKERRLLALLTDGPLESQQRKIEALKLASLIPVIVCTAAFGPRFAKPNPPGFALVEERTGCSGEECLYVGDNPQKDFDGPRLKGWHTLRVRRPGSLQEAIESGPDVEVDAADLTTLADLLGVEP